MKRGNDVCVIQQTIEKCMKEEIMLEAKTRDELHNYIITHGCYSIEENSRIYEKWFARGARYLFRAVDEKYNITKKAICDVGCAYGVNLIFCASGSYGIEIDEYEIEFARSLGLLVYQRDILNGDLYDLPKVDVVWCSAVLEHVDSPHIFLRKLHLLLKPGGLLVLYVPTIPIFPWLRYLPGIRRYMTGYLASDHINAFVPATFRFFCERAGFKTIEVSPFYPGALRLLNHIPIANRLVDGCVYVGHKLGDWEYPDKATRRVAVNRRGFVWKN
jgi:2-polyprenyl-3-methyl-5-hydroxy-6-metoxy-1,4-benzoquinol methylase